MKISNVLGGLFQNQDIQQIYYKTYKLFDIEEVEQRPCPLKFPIDLVKSSLIKENFAHPNRINKLEFMYYKDFYNFIENQEDEYITDLLIDKTNTQDDYFLNDEHSVFFQITYNTKIKKYNFYVLGATKNIIIKNNHLSFYKTYSYNPGSSLTTILMPPFNIIKFNNELHLENNSLPVDLSGCFMENWYLQKIQDFDKIGIKYINNLYQFCYNCYSLETGLSELFTSIENSEVLDLRYAFKDVGKNTRYGLESLNLQKIQLSSQCESNALEKTFYNARLKINITPQIRHFNYSNLTSLNETFYQLIITDESITNKTLDLSNLDFSNIITMKSTFERMYSYDEIRLDNSLFPDLQRLESTFHYPMRTNRKIYLTNVSFPSINWYDQAFYSGINNVYQNILYNFDFQINLWSKDNQIQACQHNAFGCDLTNIDMSNCINKLLSMNNESILSYALNYSIIDYIDISNQTFEFSLDKTEVYTKYDINAHSYVNYWILCQTRYTAGKFRSCEALAHCKLNRLDANNCTFSSLNITTTQIYNEIEQVYSFNKLTYYNIIDKLFQYATIKIFNMDNCYFGDKMIPIFSQYEIEEVNLSYPNPIFSEQELSIPPLEDEYNNPSWNIWSDKLFSLQSLKKLNLQGFIFPYPDVFGYRTRYFEHYGLVRTYSGVANRTIKKINLSYTNISSLYLRYPSSLEYVYPFVECNALEEINLSHLDHSKNMNFDKFYNFYFSNVKILKINDNIVYDYDTLEKLIHTRINEYYGCTRGNLEKIDISNITYQNIDDNIHSFNLFNYPLNNSERIKELKCDNLIIPSRINKIKITGLECYTSIDLNTFLDGQFLNNTELINSISIQECDNLTSIKLLPSSYFNINSYEENNFNFYKNKDLITITFADNNKISLPWFQSLNIQQCQSLTSISLDNIFSHIFIEDPAPLNTKLDFNFKGCTSLTTFNSELISTAYDLKLKIKTLSFYNCTSLQSINLNKIDFSDVSSLQESFANCSSLTTISSIILKSSPSILAFSLRGTFSGCHSLINLTNLSFEGGYISSAENLFAGCSSLVNVDLHTFNFSETQNLNSMFANCSSLISLDLSGLNVKNPYNLSYMFKDCTSLTNINISDFDTSKTEYFTGMFENCSSLHSINLSNFDTSASLDFTKMFCGCSNLENLDISNFNMNNAMALHWPYYSTTGAKRGLSSMFKDCISLRHLNMFPVIFPHEEQNEHYKSCVLNLDNMFENCQSLTQLDLQGFYVFLRAVDTETTDHVVTTELYGTFMQDTFKGCTNLKTIYTDQTDTASFYYDNYETAQQLFKQYTLAFSDCDSLEGGNGTTYQNMKIKYPNPDIYNDVTRFGEVDQGEVNEGYFTYKSYN